MNYKVLICGVIAGLVTLFIGCARTMVDIEPDPDCQCPPTGQGGAGGTEGAGGMGGGPVKNDPYKPDAG